MSSLGSLVLVIVLLAIMKLYVWAQERYWQDLQQAEQRPCPHGRLDTRNDAIRVNPPQDRP